MLKGRDRLLTAEAGDNAVQKSAVHLGNERSKALTDQILALSPKVAAIGLIDKGQGAVQAPTADELCLAFNDGSIPSLTGVQRLTLHGEFGFARLHTACHLIEGLRDHTDFVGSINRNAVA